jgi:hypothetical protein
MLELSVIRDDLKEIRYYYSHKDIFEKASKSIGAHSCIKKINKYNDAIRFAPARLYELYVSLYLDNNTLESLADKEGYSYVHIQRIHGQLVKFFQDNLDDKEENV